MKRILGLILTGSMLVGILTGCAGTPVVYYTECKCDGCNCNNSTTAASNQNNVVEKEEVTLSEGALKTGLAIVSSVAKSEDAKQADYDVTHVAVLVDDAGVIQDCIIDGITTNVAFDEKGTITSDLNAAVSTKNELGENYGMVAWGGAIAEWNEQAASFAKYITGKTISEVAGIAVDENTKPVDADLTASVTIKIGGFKQLIEKLAQ